MIVSQEVQEAVEGQDAPLGRLRVAEPPRLPPCDAAGDRDVAEAARPA